MRKFKHIMILNGQTFWCGTRERPCISVLLRALWQETICLTSILMSPYWLTIGISKRHTPSYITWTEKGTTTIVPGGMRYNSLIRHAMQNWRNCQQWHVLLFPVRLLALVADCIVLELCQRFRCHILATIISYSVQIWLFYVPYKHNILTCLLLVL